LEDLYQRGHTIILVTHERDIASHARRTIHLRDGVIEMDHPGFIPELDAAVASWGPSRTGNMKRFLYELEESWRIAYAQMRSNLTRSTLTALGVIIGIVAVTLMGTAIGGIQVGFDKSMAVLGDDVLYVTQWPWKAVDDWWNYRDRKKIQNEYAETINRMIAAIPNSNLVVAVPTSSLMRSIKYGGNEVENVFTLGTTSDCTVTSTIDCKD